MAHEALTKGFGVLSAPDINIVRSPLDGRLNLRLRISYKRPRPLDV